MAKHIVDHSHQVRADAPVTLYAGAARRLSSVETHPKMIAVQRRAKGRLNPMARMRAYLRIERASQS